MESQYAPLVRWVLDVALRIGFACALALPGILGLAVAAYSLFSIGYGVGYLVVPFLTWGRLFPAPRAYQRGEVEKLCVRRCRLWNLYYTIDGTRYLLPQFVSTVGWAFLIALIATAATLLTVVVR